MKKRTFLKAFMLLLIIQGLLYIKLQKSFGPISSLYKQLKRHKSSTGYGFDLFIIKNIIVVH